jgi:hypothetical protein
MNIPDLDTVDEQLTAYLDGELTASEAASIEKQLVESEPLRLRLAELRRAYELLDELPETPHNQRFTRSTLELVVTDLTTSHAKNSQLQLQTASKKNWWAFPRVLALVASFLVVGGLAGLAIRAWRTQSEMSELGLVASMPGMSDVHELHIAVKLSEEKEALGVLRKLHNDRLIPAIPESVWNRKTWVKSLTPLQIERMNTSRESIRKLDKETYARFAAIESQIEHRPDSQTIQETVHIVGLVMDRLSRSKRMDLDGLTSEQRLASLREHLNLAAAMAYAAHLSNEDAKALEEWDEKVFRPALLQELRPNQTLDTKDLLNILLFRRRLESGFQLDNQNELIDELATKLSVTGKTLIEGIHRTDQLRVLYAWLLPDRINSTQGIIDAYEKRLSPEVRDSLDLADPEQSKRMVEDIMKRPQMRNRARP